MAVVRPFRGIRPDAKIVEQVASLPYDVMNRAEAKEMAKGNPNSFLHICRSEIDLPDSVSQYETAVYEKAKENIAEFLKKGILVQDGAPVFYIYRQIMWGRVQTGIVASTSVDDYNKNIIKKHEFTRKEKELDRINHFDICDCNTEPIFLTYRKNAEINSIINEWIKFHKPIYDFKTDDEITHIFWPLDDPMLVKRIEEIFKNIEYLYIADGHHRSASAAEVGKKRRELNPNYTGDEEFNYFMSVIFPDEDLFIMDYNRTVKDLNGLSEEEFLAKLAEVYSIEKVAEKFRPMEKHVVAMLLAGQWYKLVVKDGTYDANDPVNRLDTAILQKNVLQPILGIADPRTDKRIDFIGGIRGLEELEKRCNLDMQVAFAMYPTTIEDLISVADSGEVMPPKSTWFEPKLRSGLFMHKLS